MSKDYIIERKKAVMNKRLFEQLKEEYRVNLTETVNSWINILNISVNGEIEKHYSSKQYHNTPIENLYSILKCGKIGGENFGGVVCSSSNVAFGLDVASGHVEGKSNANRLDQRRGFQKRFLCTFTLKRKVLEQIYFTSNCAPKIELYNRLEYRLLEWDLNDVSELILYCDIRDLKSKYRAVLYQFAKEYPHIRIYDKSREKNKKRCIYNPCRKEDYTLLKIV